MTTKTNQKKLAGRYVGWIMAGMTGLLCSMYGALQLAGSDHTVVKVVLALTAGLGVLLGITGIVDYVMHGDELQRRMILEAVGVGCALALLVATIEGVLSLGFPGLRGIVGFNPLFLVPIWAAGFGLGMALTASRNRAL